MNENSHIMLRSPYYNIVNQNTIRNSSPENNNLNNSEFTPKNYVPNNISNINFSNLPNQNYNKEEKNKINTLNPLMNNCYYAYDDFQLGKVAKILFKDQSGCRFLQNKIKNDTDFANNIIFKEIKYDIK